MQIYGGGAPYFQEGGGRRRLLKFFDFHSTSLLIFQLRKSRFSFERHYEKRFLFVIESCSRFVVYPIKDSVLNEQLLKNRGPYQLISKKVQDFHECLLNLPNFV